LQHLLAGALANSARGRRTCRSTMAAAADADSHGPLDQAKTTLTEDR
jgi:hypothetical protein